MRATWLFIGSAILMTASFGCGSDGQGGTGGQSSGSSSAKSSSAGMGGAGGAGMPCMAPGDCPGQDNACGHRTCDMGLCGMMVIRNMPATSQVYGDCKRTMCDDMGKVSIANDDKDAYDDGNPCTVDACTAGSSSNTPAMVGMMCGGAGSAKVCDMNAACVQCAVDMDCMGSPGAPTCSQGKCVPTACTNKAKDGMETDVDCGGPACGPCADMKACKGATDCMSGVCTGPINNKTCQTPSCGDGVLNGNESDVDCGGSCAAMGGACDMGQKCKQGADCSSSVCKGGACEAPSCADGLQNGTEKGVDCGGSCPACP